MAEDVIILGRPFLESTRAQIDVFNEEISFEIGSNKFKINIDSYQSMEKIYMVDIAQEEETFNPLEIGIDLFSYESPACLEFEQRTRSYGTPNPHDEIAKLISFSRDRKGLVKIWHVCKPIHITYDDGSGEDCGMWTTCNPNSKFCFGYNEVFGVRYGQQKIDDTTRERRGRSFICITDPEDEALPLRRVNGAQFKAMIRKELEGNKIQKLRGNYRDRLDSKSCGEMQESDKKQGKKDSKCSIPINRGLIQAILTSLPPQPIGEFKYEYSSPVHEALSLVRADLLSPPKRIRDSDSMTDFEVEEGYVPCVPRETGLEVDVEDSCEPYTEPDINPDVQADIDECFVYADAIRARRMDVRVVVETAAEEEVESSARGTVEVEVDMRVEPVIDDDVRESVREDVPDHVTSDGAVEVTYETLGDFEQRFHDHTMEILAHRIQRDNMRLVGMLDVERQRVDRLRRSMSYVQMDLRQILRFCFYDRVRIGRLEAYARRHLGYRS
ncbi:hypothetical protein Tco_1312382 [Tanacetum coccineum]